MQVGYEVAYKEDFDSLWEKYTDDCRDIQRLSYNTMIRKKKTYDKYLKDRFKKKVSKITEKDIISLINNADTTIKQKNQIIKEFKTFFNWCIKENYLIVSPVRNIKKFTVEKSEMKYWTPDELSIFLKTLDADIENDINTDTAYRTKIFTLIEFSLGNRVGETRALTYECFDNNLGIVKIKHSINYDRASNDFLSNTKNYHSQRIVDVTSKLIEEVNKYNQYLINYGYNVKDTDIIFFNYSTNKPYSDATLRQSFKYYCNKANVSKSRMYDLRHTYVATMMLEGKELYHISERIGHSDYSTTVNKYGHLSTKTRKEIAAITDKYF